MDVGAAGVVAYIWVVVTENIVSDCTVNVRLFTVWFTTISVVFDVCITAVSMWVVVTLNIFYHCIVVVSVEVVVYMRVADVYIVVYMRVIFNVSAIGVNVLVVIDVCLVVTMWIVVTVGIVYDYIIDCDCLVVNVFVIVCADGNDVCSVACM